MIEFIIWGPLSKLFVFIFGSAYVSFGLFWIFWLLKNCDNKRVCSFFFFTITTTQKIKRVLAMFLYEGNIHSCGLVKPDLWSKCSYFFVFIKKVSINNVLLDHILRLVEKRKPCSIL